MTRFSSLKSVTAATLAVSALSAGLTVSAQPAAAVSMAVKMACMSDYLSNCSQHAIGSPALRSCMRSVGPRLSKSCVRALVGAGEVSQAEVDRRKAAMQSAAK